MNSDIEILFYKFRDTIPAYKSKQFIKWFKEKYPHLDLHHILGSPFGIKSTDYLACPLEHFEHIEKAHKDLTGYFENNIALSVKILIEYVIHLENNKSRKLN